MPQLRRTETFPSRGIYILIIEMVLFSLYIILFVFLHQSAVERKKDVPLSYIVSNSYKVRNCCENIESAAAEFLLRSLIQPIIAKLCSLCFSLCFLKIYLKIVNTHLSHTLVQVLQNFSKKRKKISDDLRYFCHERIRAPWIRRKWKGKVKRNKQR